jgi:hypothetical protein
MPVPISGAFNIFGTSNTTIQGAIVEGGASTAASANDFNTLRSLSDVAKFNSTYAGNITSLSQITNALQYRGYPAIVTPPPPLPSFITATNKLPIFGTGGATVHPPSGWTSLQNSSSDDAFVTFNTSFNFTINNTNYTAHNLGSNTYITWGGGSNAYSGLSASNPALNKLHLGSADNSYQRVSRLQVSNYSRVRYEGTANTTGTVGSPTIVLEVTIFNPTNYGGQQVIEVLVGNHNRTAGQAGIATTSTYYTTWTMAVNTSFVLVGNSTGTAWTRYLGHVNNSGY